MLSAEVRGYWQTCRTLRKPLLPGHVRPWEMQLRRDLPVFWAQIEQAISDSISDIADDGKRASARAAFIELLGWVFGPLYYRFASSGVKLSAVLMCASEHLYALLANTDEERDATGPFFALLKRTNPQWERRVRTQLRPFRSHRFLLYFYDIGHVVLWNAENACKERKIPPADNPYDPDHPENWKLGL
ncbi:MAG: hypothetical protein Q7S28_00840 [bacterium]|nr:hypothetical protein [bacterium]